MDSETLGERSQERKREKQMCGFHNRDTRRKWPDKSFQRGATCGGRAWVDLLLGAKSKPGSARGSRIQTRRTLALISKSTDTQPTSASSPNEDLSSRASLDATARADAAPSKYYLFLNGLICSVGFASHQFVTHFQKSGSNVVVALLAVHGATSMRIAAMVLWFEWFATKKTKILGDKRVQLTVPPRTTIYLRILWLVVPADCFTFWITIQPAGFIPSHIVSLGSFLVEFAAFIPKSLVFEVIFDLFHYGTHWLCYQSTYLYQHAHKRHHMHLHPCPLSIYELDAVNLCLTNMMFIVLAMRIGFPLTALQLHLVLAYKTYVEVAGHSGLESKGFSFPQLPWLNELFPICLRVHDHDLHHTHPKFNFAKRFSLWDKLFGTFRPGKPEYETTNH